MSKFGWGKESNGATMSLEELCKLAETDKSAIGTMSERTNQTPGKSIEVYIVRGDLPEHYLEDNDDLDYFYGQIHVLAFYEDKDNKKQGVTLYRKKDEDHVKFFTTKEVFGRALGRGVGEALLHPQIWTNFLTIHKHGMLESAAKIPLWTDDPAYSERNKIQDMENLEITVVDSTMSKHGIQQIPTAAPANIQLYANEINTWYDYAQLTGAAFDPLMGKEATSGTTFRGQERTVAQGEGLHNKRRGQRAKFVAEIYEDWILPDMVKEITGGVEFMSTLDLTDFMWVRDKVVEGLLSKKLIELTLEGKTFSSEERDSMKQKLTEDFMKAGNKRKLEILEGEFKDIKFKVEVTVGTKQRNLSALSDKYLSIIQFAMQNTQGFQQAMQIPALANAFSNLLEFSGLSIADFSTLLTPPQPVQPVQPTQPAQPTQQAAQQPAQLPQTLSQPV
jgi:hypothetical protein